MPEYAQLPFSEGEFKEFVGRIREAEKGNVALHEVAGVSEEELQDFLENKAGLPPGEEAAGSPMATIVSVAYHC